MANPDPNWGSLVPEDRPVSWFHKVALRLFSVIDGPVTYVKEGIIEPLQSKNKSVYYHQRFPRVPTIDECYMDDKVCMFEANMQYKRDRMVDTNILSILRRRYEDCRVWEGLEGNIKCQKFADEFREAETNFFIKYGDLHWNAHAAEAFMKQKHRMIWERRNGPVGSGRKDSTAEVIKNMEIQSESPVELDLPAMDTEKSVSATVSEESPIPLEMEEEGTLFNGLIYLGAAAINAPRSVVELQKNITVLNNEMDSRIFVILSIPTNFTGTVRIYDQEAQSEIRAYPVQKILFCVRGRPDGPDGCCFGFTVSHGETPESVTFLSHVFKAETVEVASKVLSCFGACFQSRQQSNSLSSRRDSFLLQGDQTIAFEMNVDIKEDDGKGNYFSVPKDRANIVKLKRGIEKMVHITVRQTQGPVLKMERCFGVLLCAGWRQKDSDMNLLDMTSMGNAIESTSNQNGQTSQSIYVVSALWNPNEPVFELLNTETAHGIDRYLTIAVDMVLLGVAEPVRFCIDLRAKIYPPNERFWQFTKRSLGEKYFLKVEPVQDTHKGNNQSQTPGAKFRLLKCDRQSDLDKDSDWRSDGEMTEDFSDEEIVLSGMGDVSKEVTDDALMTAWTNVMAAWKNENYAQRPRNLASLVRKKGVPEALRAEVWQLLSGAHEINELLDKYRRLVVEECTDYDAAIIRDMNRTFPANNFFRSSSPPQHQPRQHTPAQAVAPDDSHGESATEKEHAKDSKNGLEQKSDDDHGIEKPPMNSGQESLVRVCRAYAIYDREIGYCQGISFLAAALLLHMPEEQAFCVLFKMMSNYGLRELYLSGFDKLYLSLHQLDVMMLKQLPDLADHFQKLGVESHMFASQWFLTLFIAKFPLPLVFHILDVFFLDGFPTLFAVALSLLTVCRQDLLKLDFEGVLKYFRINMPKRFRSDQAHRQLMTTVASKIPSEKVLTKLEQDWRQAKIDAASRIDAAELLQKENRSLMERLTRLETENDSLAQELINTRLNLRTELETTSESNETLKADLDGVKILLKESLEDKWRLEQDLFNLKDVCRKETERLEKESSRNFSIVKDYKEINARLTNRLEQQEAKLEEIQKLVENCDQCGTKVKQAVGNENKHTKEGNEHLETNGQTNGKDHDQLVQQLEVELASTKLALVEAQCEIQELRHDRMQSSGNQQQSQQHPSQLSQMPGQKGFGFLQKTISLMKDVTGQVAQTAQTASINYGGISSTVSTPSNSTSASSFTGASKTS